MNRIPRISCIYKITCDKEGRSYIGKTQNVGSRWWSHLGLLSTNAHPNPELQRVYNQYGADSLSFSILDTVPVDDLSRAEAYWVEKYGLDNLYNVARVRYPGYTDVDRFVSFINDKWLCGGNFYRKPEKAYRLWRDIDKAAIVEMAIECKLLKTWPHLVTFINVIKLMESELGYTVASGRSILDGRKTTYKLITAYDPTASTYVPPYPAPDSTPVSTN